MPTAASSSVADSGSSRTPVSSADRPSTTDRYSGTTKKTPICTRYWKKNMVRPPTSWELARIEVSSSGSPPRALTRASHWKKAHTTPRPATNSHTTGEM